MSEHGRPTVPAYARPDREGLLAYAVPIYAALTFGILMINVVGSPRAWNTTLVLSGAFLAVTVAGWIDYLIRLRRKLQRFLVENVQAVAALNRGEMTAAHDTFWRWAESSPMRRVSAVARHNLGWTLMRQGELQRSIDVLTDNDTRNRPALKAVGLEATTAVDLALDYFLLGDFASGERWLDETARRAVELTPLTLPAMQAFARAVRDCRSDRCADAARLLDDHWVEYEAALTGDILRPLRVLRSFAIAAAGPRDAGLAETALAALRPSYPAEYEFLGVGWPEMAQFLTSHGLVRG